MINVDLEKVFVIPEFDQAKWRSKICSPMPNLEKYENDQLKIYEIRAERENLDHLRPTYESPLLNKDQEQHLFRLYNYYKYRAKKELATRHVKRANEIIAKAIKIRNQLVECNLRLATIVVKSEEYHEECYAEAYFQIMRAIDYFDYRRDLKFSTYCTWVLKNNLSRYLYNLKKHTYEYIDALSNFELIEKESDYEPECVVLSIQEEVRNLLNKVKDERQLTILKKRFGIDSDPMIYTEIGKEFGISKERVRQILEVTKKELRKTHPELEDLIA